MKKYNILILVIVINSILFAQEMPNISSVVPVLFLPHGYVLENINSMGFENSLNSHIANISSANPAAVSNYRNISLGLAYQFESSVQPGWIANIKRYRERNYYPQSLGFICPYKMFRFGMGFSQRYNSVLDYGQIEVTTVDHPEGTGEFFNAITTNFLYCYSGLFSYSINNFVAKGSELSFGLTGCINNLNVKEKIYRDRINEDFTEFSWSIGIQYKDINSNQIGISYIKSPLFRDSFMYENYEMKIDSKMPDKLQFGILYSFNQYFAISLDLTNVYWHQRSDDLYNYADISGSIRTNITKQISFSLSFLSTGYNSDSYFWNLDSNLRGFYLLGGLNLRFKHYDLDLAYAENTNGSGDWRKQKTMKIALGLYL